MKSAAPTPGSRYPALPHPAGHLKNGFVVAQKKFRMEYYNTEICLKSKISLISGNAKYLYSPLANHFSPVLRSSACMSAWHQSKSTNCSLPALQTGHISGRTPSATYPQILQT
jgi:hypothetical protein